MSEFLLGGAFGLFLGFMLAAVVFGVLMRSAR